MQNCFFAIERVNCTLTSPKVTLHKDLMRVITILLFAFSPSPFFFYKCGAKRFTFYIGHIGHRKGKFLTSAFLKNVLPPYHFFRLPLPSSLFFCGRMTYNLPSLRIVKLLHFFLTPSFSFVGRTTFFLENSLPSLGIVKVLLFFLT